MPVLVYKNNRGKRTVFQLTPDIFPIYIGRAKESTIRFTNASISRAHAELHLVDDTVEIHDLGSRNGVFINGEKVASDSVGDRDVIHFGEVPTILLFDDGEGASIPDEFLDPTPAKLSVAVRQRRKELRAEKGAKSRSPLPVAAPPEPPEALTVKDAPEKTRVLTAEEFMSIPAGKEEPAARREKTILHKKPVQVSARKKKRPTVDELPPPLAEEPYEATSIGIAPFPEPVAEPEPEPEPPAKPVADTLEPARIQKYLDQIATLTRERDEAVTELKDVRLQLEQLEQDHQRKSNREDRFEIELEALSEKYRALKDQSRRHASLVEDLREEITTRDEQIFDVERELVEVQGTAAKLNESIEGSQDVIKDLKVAITQRDRRNEDAQRQLDLTEFEYRKVKEELEALQSGFNQENTDMKKTERRLSHMKEILEEKEAHIENQRLQLQEKDQEIRLARMGVGIEDLEAEKRKVLEDFYKKSHEVEKLEGEMRESAFQSKELQEQLNSANERVDQLQNKKVDVTGHPDFKALERKLNNAKKRAQTANEKTKNLEATLATFSPDDRERLENEIRFLNRKLEATKEKSQSAKRATEKPVDSEAVNQALESFEQWRTNLALMKTYVRNLKKVTKDLPDGTHDSIKGLEGLSKLLQTDGRELEKKLKKLTTRSKK